jgi:hypothetical protein
MISTHRELTERITRLYRDTSSPFGTVVTEGLRAVGVPVSDELPAEEIRSEVAAILDLYSDTVLRAAGAGDPFRDILGPVFEEVSSHGGRQVSGQFFTPWDVCVMLAEMHLHDWRPALPPEGATLWSVGEPACGSGAMLLGFLAHLYRHHGPSALRLWSVHAADLDRTLARTCALQIIANLAAIGAPIGALEVLHHDTLRVETKGVVVRMYARPDPVLDALALLRGLVESTADEGAPEPASPTPEPVPAGPAQLALFGAEA